VSKLAAVGPMNTPPREQWRRVRRQAMYRIPARWAFGVRREIASLRPPSTRSHRPPIKLWWWRGNKPNFGDELTWILIERLTGRRTVRRPLSECDVVGIGSHMERVYAGVGRNRPYVVGSGFLSEGPSAPDIGLPVLALRGELTRSRVPDAKHDVVLGDPGLLAHTLVNPARPVSRQDRVTVIPHYLHAKSENLAALKEVPGVTVVDVRSSPIDIVHAIADSRFVYSSGLHGLIAADALGVPNAWFKPGAELHGGDNKFIDYYSSIGATRRPIGHCVDPSNVVDFARENVDNPNFLPPFESVRSKQEELGSLFSDLHAI
jgi:pyruvyltransferase